MFPDHMMFLFNPTLPLILADVDVGQSIINICNWIIALGLALGTVGFVGVGIAFIFVFDDVQSATRVRRSLVYVILGIIILYSAAGLAQTVKERIVTTPTPATATPTQTPTQ